MKILNSKSRTKTNSYIISACILSSRVLGLIREIILARLLGTSIYSDALKAAIRIPNFLQNLLGEGVLSASLIPVYSRLRANNKEDEASLAAIQVGFTLTITSLSIGLLGSYFSLELIDIFAAGFDPNTKIIAAEIMRYIFPGTSILVISAWCLGVLNSHRHFLLSYSAPLLWNLVIIGGLFFFSENKSLAENSILAAKLFLLGSFLQLFIQLFKTLKLLKKNLIKKETSSKIQNIKLFPLNKSSIEIFKNFPPVMLGKGVIQISAYLDTIVASFLSSGSLSALMYAQMIYTTPISVFGLSNAAASLPELSEKNPKYADKETKEIIKIELSKTLKRVFLFCFMTSLVLAFFGLDLIKLILESGKFDSESSILVYSVLLAFLPGLIPSTLGRVIISLLYATDAQTLVSKIVSVRLLSGGFLGMFFCFYLLPSLGWESNKLVTGIGYAGSIASVIELLLLNRASMRLVGINPLRELVRVYKIA